MSDLRDLLERGVGGYAPHSGGLERTRTKMHRRQTSRKVATIVVALAIGGAGVGVVFSAFGRNGTPGEGPQAQQPAAALQLRPVVAVVMPIDSGYAALAPTCRHGSGCTRDQLLQQQEVILVGHGKSKWQLGPVILTGADVATASTVPNPNGGNGGWRVNMQLTPSGATALRDATSAAIGAAPSGDEIAFVVNGRVVSAIVVQTTITSGNLQVSNLSEAGAQALAAQLSEH